MRPFSLNLTDVEPDVTYCLHIQTPNNSFVLSECGIEVTEYKLYQVNFKPCEIFKVIVTPVNGVGNGTTTYTIADYFLQQGN